MGEPKKEVWIGTLSNLFPSCQGYNQRKETLSLLFPEAGNKGTAVVPLTALSAMDHSAFFTPE